MKLWYVVHRSPTRNRANGKKIVMTEGYVEFERDDAHSLRWPAKSGGWKKGPMGFGPYKLSNATAIADIKANGPYKGEGYPWFITVTPDFDTDRDKLGLHGEGDYEGTEGCTELINDDIDFFETVAPFINSGALIDMEVI